MSASLSQLKATSHNRIVLPWPLTGHIKGGFIPLVYSYEPLYSLHVTHLYLLPFVCTNALTGPCNSCGFTIDQRNVCIELVEDVCRSMEYCLYYLVIKLKVKVVYPVEVHLLHPSDDVDLSDSMLYMTQKHSINM